jgi:hypothetical protein
LLVLRRRTVFATPFVVVLGCSHPGERATTTTPMTIPDDAPVKTSEPVETASDNGNLPCPEGRRCNPPAPVVEKIVIDGSAHGPQSKEADGLFFRVSLDMGGEVTSSFTGVFLDDRGPIADTEFVVKTRSGKTLICVIKGRDQLPSKRVRIYEPGAR